MANHDDVAMSDEVRDGLAARWTGCYKVRIEAQAPGNKWVSSGLGTIEVECEPNAIPKDDLDKVAHEVMQRIDRHYHHEGLDSQWYRIACRCRIPKPGKPSLILDRTLGFKILYEGDDGITTTTTTDSDQKEIALEELRNEVLADYKTLLNDLHGQLTEAHSVIVQQGSQIKLIAEPISHAVELAKNMWVTGVTLQHDALKREFDANRARAEKDEANKRFSEVMSWLGPGIQTATNAGLMWLNKQMGAPGGEPNGHKRKGSNGHPKTNGHATNGSEPGQPKYGNGVRSEPEPEPEVEEEQSPPRLRDFTERFASFMTPQQNLTILNTLTKGEARLLYQLLEAEAEEEIAETFMQIQSGAIPMQKLVALNGSLDPDQQRCLLYLRQLVGERFTSETDEDDAHPE